MSEEEKFVARWSRLKRASAKGEAAVDPQEADDSESVARLETEPDPAVPAVTEPPFDVASLPPVESITADTDIRAFLQSGVPAELTKAALRRVWTTDPAIRDFIGIAENQWDFTDPTAMPGFGPLEATDKVGDLVAQAMGRLPEANDLPTGLSSEARQTASQAVDDTSRGETQLSGMPAESDCGSQSAATVETSESVNIAASQHAEDEEMPGSGANRRGHGRALPK